VEYGGTYRYVPWKSGHFPNRRRRVKTFTPNSLSYGGGKKEVSLKPAKGKE